MGWIDKSTLMTHAMVFIYRCVRYLREHFNILIMLPVLNTINHVSTETIMATSLCIQFAIVTQK